MKSGWVCRIGMWASHGVFDSFLSGFSLATSFPHALASSPTKCLPCPSHWLERQDLGIAHVAVSVPLPLQSLLPGESSLAFLTAKGVLQGLGHSPLCDDPPPHVNKPMMAAVGWPQGFYFFTAGWDLWAQKSTGIKLKFLHIQLL